MVKTITILILMLFALNLSSQTTSLSGDGSETNPYLIGSVADLEFMRDKVNDASTGYVDAHYKLTANLQFADDADSWIPIGADENKLFKGTFDGGGCTIGSIKIGTKDNPAEIKYAGLFGYTEDATISNLSVAWKGLYVSYSFF